MITENTAINTSLNPQQPYQERYRPHFHFSPLKNWMNDPNGLVYYKGEYHLFYQHYPEAPKHGPMHWGHAVSKDLVHWEHLPIALYPDDLGFIFSGNAIVDAYNDSGLQKGDENTLIAFFTHATEDSQVQSLAYSHDRGRTWHKYENNPIIKNPGIKDFRDPFVFRYEKSGKWIMVLAVKDRVHFYSSKNLTEWVFESEFGQSEGSHGGVWECPWLKEIENRETGKKKWVLTVSIISGGPAGSCGTQYFIGEFDGTTYINDNNPDTILWLDYGKDNYASIPWSFPDQQCDSAITIGWMNNWIYADKIPTDTWRGAATLPKEITLSYINGLGFRLKQKPIDNLKVLRKDGFIWKNITLSPDKPNLLENIRGELFEIIADFTVSDDVDKFGFKLRSGNGQFLEIGYDLLESYLYVDRRSCGDTDFHEEFPAIHKAPLHNPDNRKISMRIFLDRSSVEIFADEGLTVITEQIFPKEENQGMELFINKGFIHINALEIYPLKASW